MNVQIFGFTDCQDTRKALRFFAERRVPVHFVDLEERPATRGELRRFAGRDDLIPDLVRAGLMGIEAYYPEHSATQTAAYREMCRSLGLVATGGSDYHGSQPGKASNPGTPAIPLGVWEELKARAAQARGGSAR